ncbi:MAG: hypothetical protein APF76_15005 [Desulfitibacter sp. BRH_c19]|nr:MAG: hypothetical protein APF76_15005 [Desulfitibacter sp. BRH_c19]
MEHNLECTRKNVVGKPGAGEPHAGFEVAGAGNGLYKYRARPRPYLNLREYASSNQTSGIHGTLSETVRIRPRVHARI